MSSPRIAIASPNAFSWSETFIKAHMDKLPGVELILSDGDLPRKTSTGEDLSSPSRMDRLLRRMGKDISLQEKHVERIAEKLRIDKIDLVLAEYGVCGHAILPACKLAGVPLVAHFHGYDAFRDDALEKVGHYEELFSGAAGLVAVSREMEQQLLSLGAPKEKVFYNCYGVEVRDQEANAQPVAQRPAHFMGIGRFVDKKMPILTILAFKKAMESAPEIKLTIAGDGLLWGACKALVRTYGLENAIDLPGKMAHEEVLNLFRTCRGFVQHSIISHINDHEGTPLAVLEAMAAGVPVIATAHAGIKDQVQHEVHGLLCDEYDIDSMAAHIVRIAQDGEFAQAMGETGRKHIAENLRMDQSIDRLHKYLVQCAFP